MPGVDGEPRHCTPLEALTVAGALILLGANVQLGYAHLTTASVASLALLPVWLLVFRSYRGAVSVAVTALASVLSGALLALFGDHSTDHREAAGVVVLLLTAVSGLGVLLWSRRLMRLESVALLYGCGGLVGGITQVAGSLNPWKYQLSVPVTIIVVALAQRRRNPIAAVLSLLALGGVGAVNDSRSYAAFTVLAAGVVLWQALRPRGHGMARRTIFSTLASAALLATLVLALYSIASSLLLSGALGSDLQARSAAQVQHGGGSLIAGGRPEWAATLRLVQDSPGGFGIGAVPTTHDLLLAEAGLATVGISPDSGYIQHYMFAGHIELHSIVADAWAACGWVGVVWAGVMAAILISALASALAERRVTPLVVLLTVIALWDLGFGPIYSNLPDVILALGLAVTRREDRSPAADHLAARPLAPNPPRSGRERT